jgi:hypothetical protein
MIQTGKRLAPLALVLGLAACAAPETAPPPPAVQAATRPGVVVPPAQGVTPLVARTSVIEGGVAREVAARCDLTSPYATARFTTPATVSLPDLGSATPPVTVRCAQGGLTGTAQAQPALRVSETGMSGWPAIGVSVGTGSWGGTGVSVGGFWNGGSGDGGSWTRVVYPDLLIALR